MSQKPIELRPPPQVPSNGVLGAPPTAGPEAFARPATDAVALVRKPIYRRPAGIILLVVVVLAGIAALTYWLYVRQWEETDDAFIDGNIMPVGTKVAGVIQTIHVSDNQVVNAGDVLAEIDARDLEAKLAQAKATLDSARAEAEAAVRHWLRQQVPAGRQDKCKSDTGQHGGDADAGAGWRRAGDSRG